MFCTLSLFGGRFTPCLLTLMWYFSYLSVWAHWGHHAISGEWGHGEGTEESSVQPQHPVWPASPQEHHSQGHSVGWPVSSCYRGATDWFLLGAQSTTCNAWYDMIYSLSSATSKFSASSHRQNMKASLFLEKSHSTTDHLMMGWDQSTCCCSSAVITAWVLTSHY